MSCATVAGDVERIDGAYKLEAIDDRDDERRVRARGRPAFAVLPFLRKAVRRIVVGAALPSLKYLEK